MAFGQTGFNFFSAPAASSPFGTPPASSAPSLFGAAGSTPAFGAATASPFGAAPSTPAFGTPGSTPSLFGAASAAAASSGAFSFSMPAASSAAAPGGSTFGSLFAPAATSTPGSSLFGAPAAAAPAAQQPAGGIFGAFGAPGGQLQLQQPQQQQQLSPLAYAAALEHDNVKRELEAVAAAYMPGHTSFKFQHLFLNVVDNPAQRVKPPQVVDELSWKQALRDAGGPDNPDRLWPVPASGFDDLLKRGQAQAQALAENRQRLDQLRDVAFKLAQRQSSEVAARVAAARAKHVELCSRLLAVARHVDGLEGRLASYMGMRGELSRGKEAALSRALELLEAQLSPTSPAGLQRRLDALGAACRLRASSGAGPGPDPAAARLDERSLAQLFGVLKEHVEGLKHLQEVLRRDIVDCEIMRGSRQDGAMVPAAVNLAAVEHL